MDLSEAETAARLVGAADALARTTGAVPIPTWQQALDFARSGARRLVRLAAFATALDIGQRISAAEALDYAGSFAAARAGDGDLNTDGRLTAGLTRREFEVLGMLAERFSNREIADALVLSVRTVDRHITNTLSHGLGTLNAQAVVLDGGGYVGDIAFGRYSTIIQPVCRSTWITACPPGPRRRSRARCSGGRRRRATASRS